MIRNRQQTATAQGAWLHAWAGLLLGLLLAMPALAVPAGTVISNTATVHYQAGSTALSASSNTITTVTQALPVAPTPATLTVRRHDATAAAHVVSGTDYQDASASFQALSPPLPFGGLPLDLSSPVPLRAASVFHAGDPLFISVSDADENHDPAVVDTVLVTVQSSAGDSEVIRLHETGPDTGVFSGYLPTTAAASSAADGQLTVVSGGSVQIEYVDEDDASDRRTEQVLVDPAGLLFDSQSGDPVDGVSVTLIDVATGLPATVFGDDGVSAFPSTVLTGDTVTDGGGAVYAFASGHYRFPLVAPGQYRLQIQPPATHRFPSVIADAQLQTLPGAPFQLSAASRGDPFIVPAGPPVLVDVPLDADAGPAFLTKTASKTALAIGDFVEWRLSFRNSQTVPVLQMRLEDTLPKGFRYRKGSLRINGLRVADPVMGANGRELVIPLGTLAASSLTEIRYVTEVTVGAETGKATNIARVLNDSGQRSNQASATVQVREDFFRQEAFLIGRVVEDSCDAKAGTGVPGVRIYLENGTRVLTDAQGQWHIEGVKPGNHVVQLDTASLPDGYEVVACEHTSRQAGRAFSQFVDVRGGSLHRADFYVRRQPRQITQQLSADTAAGLWQYHWELRSSEPVGNLRAMLAVPEHWQYVPGSTRLDGEPIEDPQQMGNTLVYRLGDTHGPWQHRISLQLTAPGTVASDTVQTRALVDVAGRRNQRLESLSLTRQGNAVPEPVRHVQTLEATPTPSTQGAAVPAVVQGDHLLFDEAWLATADGRFEWLYPNTDFNPAIPALRIGIKHAPAQSVRLIVNGAQVSALNFDGSTRNAAGTAAISRWRGVDIRLGNNTLEAILLDESGRELQRMTHQVHYADAPYRAEYRPEQSVLVADGRSTPVLAVRFTDRDGRPARPGVVGQLQLASPYRTAEQAADRLRRVVRDTRKPSYTVGEDGMAYIRLEPTGQSGEVLFKVELTDGREEELRAWLKPAAREWILVGLAEGTVGEHLVSGHAGDADLAGFDNGGYTDGRIAFFAQGRIRGDWLLTAAYDTDKDKGERFRQIIDPDTYYTLYGDDAEQGYDAASRKKLYLKLERERFYAVFGDVDTGLTVTELARYSRSVTGLKSEYRGERLRYNLFVAETEQQYIRDELRGDGTSGLYRLSRGDILHNSERITLEVRDRFRSERVISSQSLNRHIDYNIDYDAGTVYFRQSVPSRDPGLNPVYVVIEYESEGDGDGNYTGGGRVALSLGGKSEVGVTAIHEDSASRRATLTGADLELALSERLTLKLEAASTERKDAVDTVRGDAYLAELTHDGDRLESTVYFREQEADFGLGQQARSENGTRKYGADARYHFNTEWSLNAEAYRQQDLIHDHRRDVADAILEQRTPEQTAYVGARLADDRYDDGERLHSNQLLLGGSRTVWDKRLTLRADAEVLVDQRGDDENSDYPHRLAVGFDYRLTDWLDVLATQEFTWGDRQDAQATLLGLRTRPWSGAQVMTGVGREHGEYGDRLFSNMGLLQNVVLNEHWHMDFAVDRTQTLSGTGAPNRQWNDRLPPASGSGVTAIGGEDFTAVSTAVGYAAAGEEWAARLEYREADSEDKWNFFSGYLRELSDGLSVSLGVVLNDRRGLASQRDLSADLRFSLAWRPAYSAWTVFNRLDYLHDRESDGLETARSRRIVNNLLLNYKPDWRSQLNLQYGAKWVMENLGGRHYDGYTDLYGAEYRYNFGPRWDLGVQASVLNSWDAGVHDTSAGISLGFSPQTNTWISLGYNFSGFRDEDFAGSEYTAKGFYLRFRLKFDQETVRALWQRNGVN